MMTITGLRFCFHAEAVCHRPVAGSDWFSRDNSGRICTRKRSAQKKLTSRFYSKIFGYKKNDNAEDNSGNSRNGYTTKTVISDDNDTIEVHVPRDRNRKLFKDYVFYFFEDSEKEEKFFTEVLCLYINKDKNCIKTFDKYFGQKINTKKKNDEKLYSGI